MGFRAGAFARIWSVEDNGNYSVANLSVSRKNKDTDKYEIEFQDGFVRLVGTAHDLAKDLVVPENGTSIKITSCDVTNKYDANKKKLYINYAIFGFEIPETDGSSTSKTAAKSKKATTSKKKTDTAPDVTDDADDELPF